MKIKLGLAIGLCGCTKEDSFEIPDDFLTDEEREEYLQEFLRNWVNDNIDSWIEVVN